MAEPATIPFTPVQKDGKPTLPQRSGQYLVLLPTHNEPEEGAQFFVASANYYANTKEFWVCLDTITPFTFGVINTHVVETQHRPDVVAWAFVPNPSNPEYQSVVPA